MGDTWSAVIDVEQGDVGLFVPVLMKFAPDEEEPLRVFLSGVYVSATDAIEAGRQSVAVMGASPSKTVANSWLSKRAMESI